MLFKALGLADHDEPSYPPAEEESRSLQAEQIAEKGWRLFQRQKHAGAEAECRKAINFWPYSALARVLHARLALQRRDTEVYGKYFALATVEQLFPPIAPVRQRALGEFVFLMMLVHAEKLYHDAEYAVALSQLDEIDRIAPNNPMAVGLRRLVRDTLSNRYKQDSFQERACASSCIGPPR